MSLDAVGLACADLTATASFYALLGVTLSPTGGAEHWEGRTPSGVRIMADSHALLARIHPGWVPPAPGGVSLCFAFDTPAEVDAVYAAATGAGFESAKEPWDAFWGQRYATVRDPDGNPVDLFAPLPAPPEPGGLQGAP